MATLGHMEEFDVSDPSSWDSYAERLSYFLEANTIANPEQKRAVLLTVCGPKTFAVIRSLTAPASPKTKTYEELLAMLKAHFSPTPSVIIQRFHFHKRNQRADETISTYIAELRHIAEHCQFGEFLNDMLRDQLVCGIQNEALQRRLLAEPNLTLAAAQEKALAAETALLHTKAIHHTATSVHTISSKQADDIQFQNNKPKDYLATNASPFTPCIGCGGQHRRSVCPFKNAVCHYCKKKGHVIRVCKARVDQEKQSDNAKFSHKNLPTNKGAATGTEVNQLYHIQHVNSKGPVNSEITANVFIHGYRCEMEIDSGAAFTIISSELFDKLFPHNPPTLSKPGCTLRDYNGQSVELLGSCDVSVQYNTFSGMLPLIVAKGTQKSLLGRNWFSPLKISIQGIHVVTGGSVKKVIEEFPQVFANELGTYKGPPVSLRLDPAISPIHMKARSVPYALRPKIEAELERLTAQGVFEPVTHTQWATPIVPVLKPNGDVRLCGDYKCTVNKALNQHPYPVPAVNQLLSTLAGGKVFAKLDLAQAYQQLLVDEASADAQTIITHRGAFRVKRLQFGISTAPGIFQHFMETLLSSIPGVVPYFDDVLLMGPSESILADRLREVLSRFDSSGIRLKKEKCEIGATSVNFLGYRIDASGIRPTESKVKAIHDAPEPKSKQELQAFLGLLNFYHSFLAHKATVAEPLHRLLDKGVPWNWTPKHSEAFCKVKQLLTSDSLLVHYDEDRPLILTTDASPYGVGAVLSHILPNGKEAPVAYYSRTMTSAERNYAQIDKEALAIIAGVKKFHNYLYGHTFEIHTDHKPLLGLLSKDSPTPNVMSPRMLRWSIMLSAYDYTLLYKPGKSILNADALSRLPLQIPDCSLPPLLEVLMLESLPDSPLEATEIAHMTAKDPILSRVLNWVWRGWPNEKLSEEFRPYTNRQHELSAHKGCLLWGSRVVIPQRGRKFVLDMLHAAHPGIVRMKALARSYVWWPRIDTDIEEAVHLCVTCQHSRHSPPAAPVFPWEITKKPWSRLHIDFAGPFQGKNFLVVVDSFSKWLEVILVSSQTSAVTISALRHLFATHGIPDVIVSDNGTAFTSEEFKTFTNNNLIRAVTIAPRRPQGNGQAERMVQTAKDALRRITNGDWSTRLARFLIAQHVTPCPTTGVSPAELLMGRRLKTCLDRLNPDLTDDVERKQQQSLDSALSSKTLRTFASNDPVYARNYGAGPKWVPAVITEVTGPVSYKVHCDDGQEWHRHVDQLRRHVQPSNSTLMENMGCPKVVPSDSLPDEMATPCSQGTNETSIPPGNDSDPIENCDNSSQDVSCGQTSGYERPQRNRVPPKWMDDYVS
ncbi:uncharacterized protein K02A2.6-like [Xenopus tropicalis]|uniref:Gypsy retrotransposon integrase-like protein 1 n=1 Tax=Xenopus tropicalis TaxID=8364 RepID=A0A8J1ISU8_XENTR|nr:uncharacterized protein K02A2.6-like [Xenopus tropicalis]